MAKGKAVCSCGKDQQGGRGDGQPVGIDGFVTEDPIGTRLKAELIRSRTVACRIAIGCVRVCCFMVFVS